MGKGELVLVSNPQNGQDNTDRQGESFLTRVMAASRVQRAVYKGRKSQWKSCVTSNGVVRKREPRRGGSRQKSNHGSKLDRLDGGYVAKISLAEAEQFILRVMQLPARIRRDTVCV